LVGEPTIFAGFPTERVWNEDRWDEPFHPWRGYYEALVHQQSGDLTEASKFAEKSRQALEIPSTWEMRLDVENLLAALDKRWPQAESLDGVVLPDFTKNSYWPQASKVAANSAVASWAPDGNRLVYGILPNSGIVIHNIQTKEAISIRKSGKDPSWSPDGRYIAFVDRDSPDEEIWIVRPDGEGARMINKGGYPSWSSDGKTLFYRTYDTKVQVMSREIDAENAAPQVAFDIDGLSYYPAVSPDGKLVAFDSAGESLRVVDRQGETKFEVPLDDWTGCLPSWSPDGRFVSFGSYGGDNKGCWVLDTKNGSVKQIIKGPVTKVSWTSDNAQVAFDVRGYDPFCIWVLPTENFFSPD